MIPTGPIFELPAFVIAAALAAFFGFEGEPNAAEFKSQDGRTVTATVRFTGNIVPAAMASVTTHDMGNGYLAHVVHYRETHTAEMRDEAREVIAQVGDGIAFDATQALAVRRYRHDRWPQSDQAIAMYLNQGER